MYQNVNCTVGHVKIKVFFTHFKKIGQLVLGWSISRIDKVNTVTRIERDYVGIMKIIFAQK